MSAWWQFQLSGQALLFSENGRLLIYAAVLGSAFTSSVLIYEEPTLGARFGASYDGFRANVPRLLRG